MPKLFFIVSILFYLSSCTKSYEDLPEVHSSLTKAGNNKEELIKVLNHYNGRSKDSLKLKSANYLISNMKDHYSFGLFNEVPTVVKSSFNYLDSLVRTTFFLNDEISSFKFIDPLYQYENLPPFELVDSLIRKTNNIYDKESIIVDFFEKTSVIKKTLLANSKTIAQNENITYDLCNINSKFLIDHIDNAFKVWKESPFARNMNFEEFSQTILTYRHGTEPIGHFSSVYNYYYNDIVHTPNSANIEEVVRRFNFYVQLAAYLFNKNEIQYGNIGIYEIFHWENKECIERDLWSSKVLNSCGIPTVIDFTPSFINKTLGIHFWNAVRDTMGIYKPFNPAWQALNDTSYFKRTSKVYRITYKENKKSPAILKTLSEEIPKEFLSPYIKDVSEQYHKVVNLTIPIHGKIEERNLGYLSIFNPNGWKIVAWGEINKTENILTFNKVPVGVVYFPGFIKNNSFSTINDPFYITNDGKTEKIILNTSQSIDMLLTLKYPRKEKLVQKMHEMHGTIIQASNKRDFSDAVNIYTLEEKDLNDLIIKAIDISENQNFRYLRLLPLPGKMVNIAILEVYSNIKGNEKIIVGSAPHILSPKENIQSNNKNLSLLKCKSLEDDATVTNVMDGNMETYYVGFTLELDLGNSMKIDQIRFAPRNANNGIEKGDNYELMYYDNKWISAGIQKAKYNYLQFNDIPSNKIYWLKNMDRGKEELSFIYRDGKQIFINHDDISKYY